MPTRYSIALCIVLSGFLTGTAGADENVGQQAVARCAISTSRLAVLGLASHSDQGDGDTSLTFQDGLEAFVGCLDSYPTLQLPWNGSDHDHAAAAAASAFLGAPAVTPQVIGEKANECLASLKTQNASMIAVDFNNVELQCGTGRYIQGDGFIVVHPGYH
jgi:hypothetical protein